MEDAVEQMTGIIETQIKNSLGDANYDRAIELLGVVRDELVDYEEPKLFNGFLRQLKEKLLKEELGGDRSELWWLVRRHRLGLIDKQMSDQSDVDAEEAKKVSIIPRSESNFVADRSSSSCRRSDCSSIAVWICLILLG